MNQRMLLIPWRRNNKHQIRLQKHLQDLEVRMKIKVPAIKDRERMNIYFWNNNNSNNNRFITISLNEGVYHKQKKMQRNIKLNFCRVLKMFNQKLNKKLKRNQPFNKMQLQRMNKRNKKNNNRKKKNKKIWMTFLLIIKTILLVNNNKSVK